MVSDISAKGLPADFWPRRSRVPARAAQFRCLTARSSQRVDELAAEAAKLKRVGVTSPFVLVDLKKWLSDFAALKEVLQEEDKSNNLSKARGFRVRIRASRCLCCRIFSIWPTPSRPTAKTEGARRR